MKHFAPFRCAGGQTERRVRKLLKRLPPLAGEPVFVQRSPGLRDQRGPVLGASFLRQRRIAMDCAVDEFPRVFVHELFHFVWLRAGNLVRRSFEELLLAEWRAGARGECGWSAEWRKLELTRVDPRTRSRRWREYCCESFCDTAAWIYSGLCRHPEFTLEAPCRPLRRAWFATFVTRGLSI